MSSAKIGICYHPITALLVDDDENYLRKINQLLLIEGIPARFYANPLQALHYINDEYKADPFTNHCITTPADKEPESFISNFDVKKLHLEIYNPQRFAQIGVCVFDQAMPAMTGLELCRQIQEEFSRKLIVTGEAGLGFAVSAFNEGVIHQFLQKGGDLSDLLISSIHELQAKYFLHLTEMALSKGNQTLYKRAPACLSDPVFVSFFQDLCAKQRITEYYLLDDHGSFLLLDANATPSWLIVKSAQEMFEIYDFVSHEGALEDIQEGLKNRKLIPYFHTKEDWNISYDDQACYRCLHPASELKGKQIYYYAYVSDPNAYYLDRNKILSLNQYLENLSPAG